VIALIPVKCVISHSLTRVFLKDINVYIMVSSLMFVMCVIRHLVIGSVLKHKPIHIGERPCV